MPIKELPQDQVPFRRADLQRLATSGAEVLRPKFEAHYYGSEMLNNIWFYPPDPRNPIRFGDRYYYCAYSDIRVEEKWRDTGEQMRFVEAEAASAVRNMYQNLITEPSQSPDPSIKANYMTNIWPAWLEAREIVKVATDAYVKQRNRQHTSPIEAACLDVYRYGRQLYLERGLIEETENYESALSDLVKEVRAARLRDVSTLLSDGVKSIGGFLLKHKTTATIDAILFEGVPVTTAITTGVSFIRSRTRQWGVYHARKLTQPTEAFYNGRWVSVNTETTEQNFMRAYTALAQMLGGRPFVSAEHPLTHQMLRTPLPFDPQNKAKMDALFASLYLQQPYRDMINEQVGLVYLREATSFMPELLRARLLPKQG